MEEHRLAQIKSQRLWLGWLLIDDDWYILGTDGHGFFKDTAGLRDGNGLISLKAIQSIDTALKLKYWKIEILKNVTKPWTCEASRNHEVPWDINAEPSRVFEKAVDFRAKKNLW